MSNTENRELTAAELDLVAGGLPTSCLEGMKASFMAPRTGRPARQVQGITASSRDVRPDAKQGVDLVRRHGRLDEGSAHSFSILSGR